MARIGGAGSPEYGSPKNWGVALFTFALVLALQNFGKGILKQTIATRPAMIWEPRISGRVKVLLMSVGIVKPTPMMTGSAEPT